MRVKGAAHLQASILIALLLIISIGRTVAQSHAAARYQLLLHSTCSVGRTQIDSAITRADFEGMRLQSQNDTLFFDNNFEVVLTPANSLFAAGAGINPSGYAAALPVKYKKPVYHINASGQISAAYEINNSKYSDH